MKTLIELRAKKAEAEAQHEIYNEIYRTTTKAATMAHESGSAKFTGEGLQLALFQADTAACKAYEASRKAIAELNRQIEEAERAEAAALVYLCEDYNRHHSNSNGITNTAKQAAFFEIVAFLNNTQSNRHTILEILNETDLKCFNTETNRAKFNQ